MPSSLCGCIKGIEMKPIKQISTNSTNLTRLYLKPIKQFFILILFTILLVLGMFSQSWAATYYVDATNGNDSSPGTSEAAPWKTIAKVNASNFIPGDFILLKGGKIWREQLTVPSSGLSGNPITFGTYGKGERPIISAADLVTAWTEVQQNCWRASVITEPNVVFFDGVTGVKKSSLFILTKEYEWHWANGALYIYSASDPSSAYTNIGVEAGNRSTACKSNGKNYIVLDGLDLRHANALTSSGGVEIKGTNWTLQNCIFQQCYYSGIFAGAGQSDTTISNCIISENKMFGIITFLSAGPNWIIEDSIIHDSLNGSGIIIAQENVVIRRCIIYNNGNISNFAHDHGIYLDQANLSIPPKVYNCEIYGNKGGNGIATKSSANIFRNKIHDNYNAGIDVSDNGTNDINVNVYNNILYNNKFGILEFIKGAGSISMGIYNNTISHNYDATMLGSPSEIGVEDELASLEIINNIIYCSSSDPVYAIVPQTNAVIDYNCVYKSSAGDFIWYDGTSKNWAWWKNNLGFDLNSINADPKFADLLVKDFRLTSTSPCINAGIGSGFAEDANGTLVPQGDALDIGALEYIEKLDPPLNFKIEFPR